MYSGGSERVSRGPAGCAVFRRLPGLVHEEVGILPLAEVRLVQQHQVAISVNQPAPDSRAYQMLLATSHDAI